MTLSSLISNFHFLPSWDLLIIVVFAAAAFLYGLSLGRGRLVMLLLATYFSFVVLEFAPWNIISPYLGLKTSSPSPTFEIFCFLALLLLFFFLMPGSILTIKKRGRANWLQILILAILQIGLLVSIILSLLPTKVLPDLSVLVKKIFFGPVPSFAWKTIPLLALVLLRKKRAEMD